MELKLVLIDESIDLSSFNCGNKYINPNLIGQIKKYRENGNIDESIKYIDERIKYIETATFLIEKNRDIV